MTPEGARWALDVWVPALRSGRYIQGTGVLYRTRYGDVEYCCLGVACDLLPELAHWGPKDSALNTRSAIDSVNERRHRSFLPESVSEFLGLNMHGYDLGLPRPLSSMNDSGSDFYEIADVIEKHALEVLASA